MLTLGEHFLFTGKTILVAPLDWGLGHASRCVPLITQLARRNTLIIGTSELNAVLFKNYFPNIEQVRLPTCSIRYSRRLPVWVTLLWQLPRMLSLIGREKRWLSNFVAIRRPDVVISDNRFGMFHKQTENVFVTHQLHILSPLFPRLATRINIALISRFDQVWVPDLPAEKERLAGRLSALPGGAKLNVKYIGALSALSEVQVAAKSISDYLILLSGPEPQRSILEGRLIALLKNCGKTAVLVRGSNQLPELSLPENISATNLCTGTQLRGLIEGAGLVICRSGYSTLMDLYQLGCRNVLLIPTPGQTEQEYLARHWQRHFGAKVCFQNELETVLP